MQEIRELLGKQPVHGRLEEVMVVPRKPDGAMVLREEGYVQAHGKTPLLYDGIAC